MSEEKEPIIYYKIMPNHKYRVWKTTKDDVNYYKIQVSQKNYDNTVTKFYKPICFRKGVDVPNQTDIIIKFGIENLRENPKDPFNPISTIMVSDFELYKSQEQQTKEALNEFNDFMDDVDIKEEDLPF